LIDDACPEARLHEIDGLNLHDAHALELFKNEGLTPDAPQRIAKFFFTRRALGNC